MQHHRRDALRGCPIRRSILHNGAYCITAHIAQRPRTEPGPTSFKIPTGWYNTEMQHHRRDALRGCPIRRRILHDGHGRSRALRHSKFQRVGTIRKCNTTEGTPSVAVRYDGAYCTTAHISQRRILHNGHGRSRALRHSKFQRVGTIRKCNTTEGTPSVAVRYDGAYCITAHIAQRRILHNGHGRSRALRHSKSQRVGTIRKCNTTEGTPSVAVRYDGAYCITAHIAQRRILHNGHGRSRALRHSSF